METTIRNYLNKTISFKFYGKSLSLATSQELFSSFEVDAGSSLLLQSIGKNIPLEGAVCVLDVGSGIGTIGLALKARNPEMSVDFSDRDALALSFTKHNCESNGLTPANYFGSLGISQLPEKKYDLVTSNIPAKAGNPVIVEMLKGFCSLLKEGGVVAVVIVKTLSDLVGDAIISGGGTIAFKNVTREYTVYHYNGMACDAVDRSLAPYVRGSFDFKRNEVSYRIESVYGVPEFDNLGYETALGMDALKKITVTGEALVVNPGQGHVPVYLLLSKKNRIARLRVASRDLLSLLVTKQNAQEATGVAVESLHIPSLDVLEGPFDFAYVNYEKEVIEDAHELLAQNLARVIGKNGDLLLVGKSTFLFRFTAASEGVFRIVGDEKDKGFRCVHYRKV
jgi:ubiquinone/menaquinone biosynthesis C-methylase UbiE